MTEQPIYLYDTFDDPADSLAESIFASVLGMRYMAVAGAEWPHGTITAFGYTKTGTYRRALRKLMRKAKSKRAMAPVAAWTEAGERVR